MDPEKKISPKQRRAKKDNQGKGCPKAAARKQTLEWVSGRAYNTAVTGKGTWLKEKKVPQRKVIGKITRLLKVLMF